MYSGHFGNELLVGNSGQTHSDPVGILCSMWIQIHEEASAGTRQPKPCGI